jgi:hypothetical protein
MPVVSEAGPVLDTGSERMAVVDPVLKAGLGDEVVPGWSG